MKIAIKITAAVVAIAWSMGWSVHVRAQEYRVATKFEQAKAYCELVANGLQPARRPVGREDVAGAAGNLFGGLITHARNYDYCMVLSGYTKQQ